MRRVRALAIVDIELKIDVKFISSSLNEEVTLNSVNQEGLSIYECGTPIPEEQWDWVAKIGECQAEIRPPIDLTIPLDDDPVGTLISAVSAVREGMVVDESVGE